MAGSDEQGNVKDDAEREQGAAQGLVAGDREAEANEVIDGGAGGEDGEVEEAEARAKEVVGEQDDGQPDEARTGGGPIKKENRRDEEKVVTAACREPHDESVN